MNAPLKGIWVDDAPRRVLTSEYMNDLLSLNINTAAIMLEDVVNGRLVWQASQIREVTSELVSKDIEVIVTFAPTPQIQYLHRMEGLLFQVADCGISGIEGDKEGRWLKRKLSGFETLQQASEKYIDIVNFFVKLSLRTEITTHTGHHEHGKNALTMPRVDRGTVQWYSTRKRNKKVIEWSGKYGPGNMQRFGAKKWLSIPKNGEKPRLSVGLAAWSQRWPGHTPEEAMQKAYDVALESRPIEIRWFATTHVIGAKKNPYAANFIRSL